MKFYSILIIAVLFSSAIFAQGNTDSTKTSNWKFKGLTGLNFTQVALSNWNGGGNSALSLNGIGTYSALYKKDDIAWENTLNMAYGIQRSEEIGTRKTDDKLEFNSKYSKQAFKDWKYTSILNFRTQFTDGFDYPNDTTVVKISDWLAPGYVNFSIGLENQPTEWLSIYVSPISSKITIVADQNLSNAGAFGVDSASTFRYEFGGLLRIAVDATLMENVTYTSTMELFSNYSENPQNIDVNWDNLLSFKINKFLSASISVNVIYDHDVKLPVDLNDDGVTDYNAPRTQLKQVTSLGVQYKF